MAAIQGTHSRFNKAHSRTPGITASPLDLRTGVRLHALDRDHQPSQREIQWQTKLPIDVRRWVGWAREVLAHGAVGHGEAAIGGRLWTRGHTNYHVVERIGVVAQGLALHLRGSEGAAPGEEPGPCRWPFFNSYDNIKPIHEADEHSVSSFSLWPLHHSHRDFLCSQWALTGAKHSPKSAHRNPTRTSQEPWPRTGSNNPHQ